MPFPLHMSDAPAKDAQAQAWETATLPRSVLLVDDNHDASSSLAELLRIVGHEVVVADDGAESLQLVDAGQSFDVALLDIGLPGMSGHELAQRLRQRFAQQALRLVALTGYDIAPDIARSNGFDDCFVKPVDLDALLASIHKAGSPAA